MAFWFFGPGMLALADSTLLIKLIKSENIQNNSYQIFFWIKSRRLRCIPWQICRGKIKNKNCHKTGLHSPEIGKRPPQVLEGGGSSFFGLGGPNHNAPSQFQEIFFACVTKCMVLSEAYSYVIFSICNYV